MRRKYLIVIIGILEAGIIGAGWLLATGDFYSPDLNLVVCHSPEACLHETGHQLDHALGDVSQSEDFQTAVRVYLTVVWMQTAARDSMTPQMVAFPGVTAPRQPDKRIWTAGDWGGYAELYASMYQWADGDVQRLPAIFRLFFEEAR